MVASPQAPAFDPLPGELPPGEVIGLPARMISAASSPAARPFGGTKRDRLLRHAEHHRRRLVLGDRRGTRRPSSRARPRAPSSPMPVMMMPSALARRTARPSGTARRPKADGATPMAVPDRDIVARAAALQQHVPVAGAISTRPRSTVSPSAASFTSMAQRPSSRRAKASVNFSGMCWTMTMPGQSAGSASSTTRNDSVPPVEAPMQTTVSVVRAMALTGDRAPA